MRRNLCLVLALSAVASGSSSAARAAADDSMLLVLHSTQPKITVLDTERGRRLKSIKLERDAIDLEIAADGKHVYLSNKNEARLTVIDLTGKGEERSIDLGGSGEARGLALSGSDLLVALSGAGHLVVVDPEKGEVKKRIELRNRTPDRVAVAGQTAYVSDTTSGSVSVIDLDRGTVQNTLQTGSTAGAITVDPAAGQVWVADQVQSQLRIIAAKSSQVVTTLDCPGGPARVVLGGGRVFALCTASADIAVMSPGARTVERRIAIRTEYGGAGSGLNRMVLEPGGKRAFLGGGDDRRILVLDLESLEIRDRFDVDTAVGELLCIKKVAGIGKPTPKREKLKKGDAADGEKKEDGGDKDKKAGGG